MNEHNKPAVSPPRLLYQSAHTIHICEGQCDCACSTSVPTGLQPHLPHPKVPYTLSPSFVAFPLTDTYHAAFERTFSLVVLNDTALSLAQFFQQPHLLTDLPPLWCNTWGDEPIQSTLHQMIALGLLVPAGCPAPPLTASPTTLSAWLHITDRCNLRCAYCYLPHIHADMSAETGQAAIAATFRSAQMHGYRQVKLKYAGGEPLLRFPFMAHLHRHAQSVAHQHTIALDGVVLSNGTLLTPAIITEMQAHGLRLMVSLDGLQAVHDQQRFYASGRGSFADVARGIDLALSYDLIPDISITVTGRNATGLPDLIHWVLERNLPFSFNFYRENSYSAPTVDLSLEEEHIIAGMRAAYRVIEANMPQRSLLTSLVDRANLAIPHRYTCGVGQSYLVFDHQGQVAKCQMQLQQPITTAHVPDPLAIVRADLVGIQNLPVEAKEGCHACEWEYWCAGGCPLATFRATGRYDRQSPNCTIYKTLYPEVVRLEGLRLIMLEQRTKHPPTFA